MHTALSAGLFAAPRRPVFSQLQLTCIFKMSVSPYVCPTKPTVICVSKVHFDGKFMHLKSFWLEKPISIFYILVLLMDKGADIDYKPQGLGYIFENA